MRPLLTSISDSLTVRPWPDPVIDQLGYDPRSSYVERFYLGILGPSTTWLMRRLVAGFDVATDGFELPMAETARWLGLGDRGGRNSPFLRTLNRTIQFDLAQASGPSELSVRRRLPPLNLRQVARLSPLLQGAHQDWLEAQLHAPRDDQQRRRGRRLALSLVELGEGFDEVERQLLGWRYQPALAREVVTWAWAQHCEAHGQAQAS
ncbi:MAG: hypothetical protein ACRDY0_11135 [Acidimicrobiales bacterium]